MKKHSFDPAERRTVPLSAFLPGADLRADQSRRPSGDAGRLRYNNNTMVEIHKTKALFFSKSPAASASFDDFYKISVGGCGLFSSGKYYAPLLYSFSISFFAKQGYNVT